MRHAITRHPLFVVALAGGALLPATLASAQTYRVLARTGETAPGTNAILDDIFLAKINAAGQVAFFGTLVNGDAVLYRSVYDHPSQLQLILRTGDDVPGGPVNATLGTGNSLQMNDDGNLGFRMSVAGLGADGDSGAFRHVDGALQTVALSGQQVPNAAVGVKYDYIFGPAMNASDSLAFFASLQGTGVSPTNDSAIFAHGIGGMHLIVRKGGVAPGRPNDTLGLFGNPGIADNGRLSFFTFLNDDSDQGAIFSGWPGLLAPLAVAGEGVPNVGGFLGYSVVDAGFAFMSHSPTSIVRDLGNGNQIAATSGGAGPIGTYAWMNQFHGGRANADGTVCLAARFTGPADDANTAVVRIRPNGQQSLLVREGDAAPGYWNGVEFADFGSDGAASIAFDDVGRFYLSVPVRGAAINAGNDRVLYGRDLNGALVPLLREGQLFNVGGGDYRIIESFSFAIGVDSGSGGRAGINQQGDIAVTVNFTDQTEALVVVQLGTPCSSDVNHDGVIDFADLLILLSNWGAVTPIGEDGDTNRDGVVDFSDLLKLLADWGFCA